MLIKYKVAYIIEDNSQIQNSLVLNLDNYVNGYPEYFGFLFKDSKEKIAIIKNNKLKEFKNLLIDYMILHNEYDIENDLVSYENLKSIGKLIQAQFTKVINLDSSQLKILNKAGYKSIKNIL